jgi:hypothetical protein
MRRITGMAAYIAAGLLRRCSMKGRGVGSYAVRVKSAGVRQTRTDIDSGTGSGGINGARAFEAMIAPGEEQA